MNYNLYIEEFNGRFNILDITEEKLNKVIEAYKKGETSITLGGTKYTFDRVSVFRIFMNESGSSGAQIQSLASLRSLLTQTFFGKQVILPNHLPYFGAEVTEEKIGNLEYGIDKKVETKKTLNGTFIDLSRLDELRTIKSQEFDLSKLIRLCEELNNNFETGNYLSVGMIGRAIIDHVPPIFKLKTFNEVTSNYGGQSFKKNMNQLNQSLRGIADSFLHMPIRKTETLPTITQIDFKQNMDVLLSEILRILKEQRHQTMIGL